MSECPRATGYASGSANADVLDASQFETGMARNGSSFNLPISPLAGPNLGTELVLYPATNRRSVCHASTRSIRASISAEEIEPSSPSSVVSKVPAVPPPSSSGRIEWERYHLSFFSQLRR